MQPEDQDPIKDRQSIREVIRENETEWSLKAKRQYRQAYTDLLNYNTNYLEGWIKRNKNRIIKNVLNNKQTMHGRKCYNKSYRLRWFADCYYKDYLRYKKKFDESRGRSCDCCNRKPLIESREERNHTYDQTSIDAYLSEIFDCQVTSSFTRVSITAYEAGAFSSDYRTKHYDYFKISIPL
jgi:hypothetical protein